MPDGIVGPNNISALFKRKISTNIKDAVLRRSFKEARKLVNGGSHEIMAFTAAYRKGEKFLSQYAVIPDLVRNLDLEINTRTKYKEWGQVLMKSVYLK